MDVDFADKQACGNLKVLVPDPIEAAGERQLQRLLVRDVYGGHTLRIGRFRGEGAGLNFVGAWQVSRDWTGPGWPQTCILSK